MQFICDKVDTYTLDFASKIMKILPKKIFIKIIRIIGRLEKFSQTHILTFSVQGERKIKCKLEKYKQHKMHGILKEIKG